jgi:hypothetical protein
MLVGKTSELFYSKMITNAFCWLRMLSFWDNPFVIQLLSQVKYDRQTLRMQWQLHPNRAYNTVRETVSRELEHTHKVSDRGCFMKHRGKAWEKKGFEGNVTCKLRRRGSVRIRRWEREISGLGKTFYDKDLKEFQYRMSQVWER